MHSAYFNIAPHPLDWERNHGGWRKEKVELMWVVHACDKDIMPKGVALVLTKQLVLKMGAAETL